jgi:hypothetical protein
MISKEELSSLMDCIGDAKNCINDPNDLTSKDILKSIAILENKIKYYSSNHDALSTLNKITSEEAEK